MFINCDLLHYSNRLDMKAYVFFLYADSNLKLQVSLGLVSKHFKQLFDYFCFCSCFVKGGSFRPNSRGHDECLRVPGKSQGTEESQRDGDVNSRGHQTGGRAPTDGCSGQSQRSPNMKLSQM